MATPEQVYHHDCMGNRVLEEGWYDDDPSTNVHKTVLVNDIKGGGCGGNGEAKAGEIRYDDEDTETGSVQYIYGKGMGSLVHELATNGVTTIQRFRHEDQAGSLIGVTDEDGLRTDEYSYTDYGQTSRLKIMFDGQDSRISSLQADTPSAGFTTINLTSADPDPATDEFNGKLLRIARPGAASQRLIYAKVEDTTTTSIIVEDVDDDVYDALNGVTQGFTVLDQLAVATNPFSFQGAWSANPTYDGGSDTTTFTDSGGSFGAGVIGLALFPDRVNDPEIWAVIVSATFTTVTVAGDLTSYAEASSEYAVLERGWVYDSGSDMTVYFDMVNGFPAFAGNWTFVPNIEKPCHLQAQGVDGNLLYFKGDTRNLADPETDRYVLLPPAGVSATTGAYAKPEDLGENDYTDRGTMWLWSGYLYVTPQVGHDVTGTTYGAQSGGNKVGSYHCWNRVYDPATGRWTTPDPAMSPWWSLLVYSFARPLVAADPSGLGQTISIGTSTNLPKGVDGSKDVVDEWIDMHAECVSRSAADFMACIRQKYDACLKAGGNMFECCISRIDVHGHAGTGFGGGEQMLTGTQRQEIADMMCDNSTIRVNHCFGDPFTAGTRGVKGGPTERSALLGLLDILSRIRGGTQEYIGFSGMTWYEKGNPNPYLHPHESVGRLVGYRVKPGDTLEDIKRRAGNGRVGPHYGPTPGPDCPELPPDYDPTQDPEYGSPIPPSE